MKKNPQDKEKELAELEAKIEAVKAREEQKLVTLARKAGFFDVKLRAKDIEAVFQDILKNHASKKLSQLKRLEDKRMRTKSAIYRGARKEDARKKILLGAFLIDQFKQNPDLLAKLQPELRKFLERPHEDRTVLANKKILAEFLGAKDG